jgi:O-antigen/teichoic acid export membrane protein
VVPLALGSEWLSIVPLLTILVPFLGLRASLSMTLPCVMALGETRLLFRVSATYALVHVPAFVAATALFGLVGSIGSIVGAGVFYTYLNAWLLKRTLGISVGEIFRQLRRSLVAAALMVMAVLTLAELGPVGAILVAGSWPSLLAKIAIGALLFSAVQYSIWRLEGRPPGIERRLLQLLSRLTRQ